MPETRNPFLDEAWDMSVTWPESHLLECIRQGRLLENPVDVQAADMLSPDGGSTPETVERERRQWEEAWNDLLDRARRLLLPDAGGAPAAPEVPE